MSSNSPIVASQLVRHFGSSDNPVRAVDGVDLEVREGEIFGFLGPNGAGKSTTVRCVTGLQRPDSGTIEVDGRDALREPAGIPVFWDILEPSSFIATNGVAP